MYAVIETGGKQQKVEPGQRLDVELLDLDEGAECSFTPILLVDGQDVKADPQALATAKVTAKVVGLNKGPKVIGFKYKSKSNYRRRWGHRQKYTTIEITNIELSD